MAKDGSLTPRNLTEQALVAGEDNANTRKGINDAVSNYWAVTGKSLPASPQDLVDYVSTCANKGYALATITTRMALLATWHDEYIVSQAGYGETMEDTHNPCRNTSVVRRMKSIRRHIAAPQDQAAPLYVDQLAACVGALDEHIRQAEAIEHPKRRKSKQLTAIRDKAMFLVAFWFGLRSESLTALRTGKLEVISGRHGNQLRIFLPETKNAVEFERTLDALDFLCPIPAVIDWMNAAQPAPGTPFFVAINQWGSLSDTPIHVDSIIPMLRKVLDLAGIESDRFTTHSFRRGASIWADTMGASTRDRMDWFGWSDPTSALKYVQAKPSLPSILQKQDDPLQNALDVISAHITSAGSAGLYPPEFIGQAKEVIERLTPKRPSVVAITAEPLSESESHPIGNPVTR